MIIDKKKAYRLTVLWTSCAFVAAYLLFWLFPNAFGSLNERSLDQILRFQSRSKQYQLPYDDTIVHIDLNNTSLKKLNNFYPNRGHHARVIRNLHAMGVAAQMVDFVFAGPTSEKHDRELIDATRLSRNAYFGMVFRLQADPDTHTTMAIDAQTNRYLGETAWPLESDGSAQDYYRGDNPMITFSALAESSKGLGYLSLKPDSDGVFRRIPLVVRFGEMFYPSFALRVVCDYLNVPPTNITLTKGAMILNAPAHPRFGPGEPRQVRIPIDRHGNMRIRYVGPWDKMKHYHFSDVYYASDDEDEMDLWREELDGKIVLISNVSTGSIDVGNVPTDKNFPLSGVHANCVHTILTEQFLWELSHGGALLIELVLLAALAALSLHRSAIVFTFGTCGIAVGYLVAATLAIIYGHTLLPIIRPILMLFIALITIHIVSAVENARTHADTKREKEIAEKELEIGRKIQGDFLPSRLPSVQGWDLAAEFKPARKVAGDFYDVFELNDGRYVGLAIADVCDKGVGAALFMALIRSLLRAISTQNFDRIQKLTDPEPNRVFPAMLDSIQQTNNYVARTHEQANMFATLFFGVLDPDRHTLAYINCGHEPPMLIQDGKVTTVLKPTGPAVGMMPDLTYTVEKVLLAPGDVLFLYTDGVTDAKNQQGDFFSRDRLKRLLSNRYHSVQTMVDKVKSELNAHIAESVQFDDMTLLVVQRKPG